MGLAPETVENLLNDAQSVGIMQFMVQTQIVQSLRRIEATLTQIADHVNGAESSLISLVEQGAKDPLEQVKQLYALRGRTMPGESPPMPDPNLSPGAHAQWMMENGGQ